jgi:DoxX-like family
MPVGVEAAQQLGLNASAVFAVGLIEVVCLLPCLVPRTSVLGAVVRTGYLGRAIATHVRVGSPLLTTRSSRSTSGRCCGPVCGCATAVSVALCALHSTPQRTEHRV